MEAQYLRQVVAESVEGQKPAPQLHSGATGGMLSVELESTMEPPGKMRDNRRDKLADVHIAEYNALTTRITYYVTLQYATWGIAAGLFGYLAPLWLQKSNRQNLEWIGLVCILAISWAVLHINYEFLVIVRYLKESLLQKMATDADVQLDEVLGFEGWLRHLGGIEDFHRNIAPNIVFGIGFLVLLVLLATNVFRVHYWSSSDTWWAFVTTPLLVIDGIKMWRLSVLSRQLQH